MQESQTPLLKQLTPQLAALMDKANRTPRDPKLKLKLARALSAAQDYEGAREVCREAVKAGGDKLSTATGELWYELLYATAKQDVRLLGRHVRDVQKHRRTNPDAAWAHRNMALVYYYTEEDTKARRALKKARELDSADPGSVEVWALLNQSDGDAEELVAGIRKALRGKDRGSRLRKMLGDTLLETGDSESAREAYLQGLGEEPLNVELWHALATLCLTHDLDYEGALRCFARALSINPRCWDVYFTLADYYVEEKQYSLAEAEVEKVLRLEPDSSIRAEVENHLGFIDYIQGDYENAVKRYRRAITLDPDFDSPWHNLGLVHVHEKDFDSAVECFEKAITLNEDRSWSYTQLGLAHFEKKQYQKARSLFLTALEKNPEEYGAHLGLAELYRKEKKYQEQLSECLKALEVEPNDGNVRNYLGIAYECNKRPEDAVKQYQEALRLDPLNRWAANNLGYLFEKQYASSGKTSDRARAVEAWKIRLLICRDTRTSTAGARRHILKLGVSEASFEKWLRDGKLETELERVL